MRQTCIDARGLDRFARLQHLHARAWTIAILLALLTSAEATASSIAVGDSLIVSRERIVQPSGSISLPPDGGLDSSAIRAASASTTDTYSEAYWDAVSALDLSASRNAARTDPESEFTEAMTSLAAGEYEHAETAFARLARNTADMNVAIASQTMLARTLMYEHKWSMLRDLAVGSTLGSLDPQGVATLARWGRAFANIEPELARFPASPVALRIRFTSVGTPAIRLKINGREFEFWLDTGSTMTVLSSDVAVAARVPIVSDDTLQVRTFAGAAKVRPALVRSIQVGAITLTNTPAIVIDASLMRIRSSNDGGPVGGYRIDGILGWDFIRQFEVLLDFQRSEVTLSKPRRLGTAGTAAQNLVWTGEPLVEMRSKHGAPLHLSLDTGAQSTFLNATVLEKLDVATRPARGRVFGLARTGAPTNRMIPGLTLDLAGRSLHFEDVIVYGPNYPGLIACDGILGSDIAQFGVIRIDATNGIFSVA